MRIENRDKMNGYKATVKAQARIIGELQRAINKPLVELPKTLQEAIAERTELRVLRGQVESLKSQLDNKTLALNKAIEELEARATRLAQTEMARDGAHAAEVNLRAEVEELRKKLDRVQGVFRE